MSFFFLSLLFSFLCLNSLLFSLFSLFSFFISFCPIGWGCRIHQLFLCKMVPLPLNKCPGYDTKQSDGEVPVMLELWGIQSTPSLPFPPGPFWPGVVAPDGVLSLSQIELNCVLTLNRIA